MEAYLSEEEIELIDYLRVIWKRRWLIVGGTLACMIVALVVSLIQPEMYQTTLDLKIGQVWQNPVDDPNLVAAVINNEPFLDKVRQKTGLSYTAYKMKKGNTVVAKVVDKAPLLVNVVTREHSPEKAVELAETVADLVIHEHQLRFDELMSEHIRYEKELEGQVQAMQREIQELETTLKRQRTNSQVNASAVVLLQTQLAGEKGQLVNFAKELREVKSNNNSKARSENTLVTFPPPIPEEHVNPKTGLNMAIAGIVGLMIFLMLAFFLEYLEQARRREQAVGHASGPAECKKK